MSRLGLSRTVLKRPYEASCCNACREYAPCLHPCRGLPASFKRLSWGPVTYMLGCSVQMHASFTRTTLRALAPRVAEVSWTHVMSLRMNRWETSQDVESGGSLRVAGLAERAIRRMNIRGTSAIALFVLRHPVTRFQCSSGVRRPSRPTSPKIINSGADWFLTNS